MNREDFDKGQLFSKVLSKNASSEEQREFELWLADSEQNQAAFRSYEKAWESASSLKQYDLVSARVKTELKIIDKLRKKQGFFYYWQRIAAILILPALLFSAYLHFEKDATFPPSVFETIKTPYGARTSFELPDGTMVWLNAGSELSYPRQFGEIREVKVKGEMYLEVKKNNKAFVVKTDKESVKVMGTKFNVTAYPNEAFRTTLVEGSIVVKAEANEIILKPGFQYIACGEKYQIREVATDLYTSWKDGKMIFQREPFELVAKRLERWFNVTIQLEGKAIKELWFTGTIEMETFSEVLAMIKNTTPIEYSFNPKTRMITITSKI